MRARLAGLENLISRDPSLRNVFSLVRPGHLRLACLSLLSGKKALIASGFPVLAAGAGETDGPPGALALGNALKSMGLEVVYLTDTLNRPLFEAVGALPVEIYRPGLLERLKPTHLIAVERPGRARDGRYYSMFGKDISHLADPLDELFLEASERNIVTIGVGDGGNEIGMGRVLKGVTRAVDKGRLIASVIPTDYVIISGVSNWGAYGLVGGLSVLTGQDLLPKGGEIQEAVRKMVAAGAVDGFSGEPRPLVDGLDVRRSVELAEEMRDLIRPSPLLRLPALKAGIIGAGMSGLAAARLLKSAGAQVRVTDQKESQPPPDLIGLVWETGPHTMEFMNGVDLVVRSPGVPPDLEFFRGLREKSVPIMSELELAWQMARPGRLAAVTGSLGKRTTVKLIGRIMGGCGRSIHIGGNKGRPLAEMVGEVAEGSGDESIALAVSSFQLESVVAFRPRIAVILNLEELHLDRHRDISETVRIKSRIFMNQGAGDTLILNHDQGRVRALAVKHPGEVLFFSTKGPVEDGAWISRGKVFLALDGGVSELGPLPEMDHPANLLAAILVSLTLGLSNDDLSRFLHDPQSCQ